MPTTAGADVNLVDAGYRGRFRAASVTVLEAPGKGPQLCLGGIAESYPPQCGGPRLIGWSWAAAPGSAQVRGTRWGSFTVVGRYDGTSFTLTQPATVPTANPTPPDDGPHPDTPCPPPAGGWRPADPAKATDATFQATIGLAEKQPGFGALWVDQRESADDAPAVGPSGPWNDPTRFVLNVTTTRDLATMERTLRKVRGGSLCISKAPRTAAELSALRTALGTPRGTLSVSSDDRAGRVELTVIRATTQQRRQLDERFGAGMVRLIGALQPID